MNYLELLRKLVALGSKLPDVWPKLVQVFTLIQEIAVALGFNSAGDSAGTLNMEAASEEESALEAQVGQLLAAPGAEAAWDGSRLRALWKFMQDTGLDSILVTLLTKLLAGA